MSPNATQPDVLIEDDCESIGRQEITYPQIRPHIAARIRSIIVPEFGGLDHLHDTPEALVTTRLGPQAARVPGPFHRLSAPCND